MVKSPTPAGSTSSDGNSTVTTLTEIAMGTFHTITGGMFKRLMTATVAIITDTNKTPEIEDHEPQEQENYNSEFLGLVVKWSNDY